jgi:hypothetical protein
MVLNKATKNFRGQESARTRQAFRKRPQETAIRNCRGTTPGHAVTGIAFSPFFLLPLSFLPNRHQEPINDQSNRGRVQTKISLPPTQSRIPCILSEREKE